MKVFPKSINEQIWKEHLYTYSTTLSQYVYQLQKIVPREYHFLLPYKIYICPLCLEKYFLETNSGVVGNSEFSIDHLPPQSTGGAIKIITCKKCNNDAGAFESELDKMLNFGINKKKLDAPETFKVHLNDEETGQSIQGLVYNKNGRTNVIFDENLKHYRKDYIEFIAKLQANKIPKLTITLPLYDRKKLARALVKSAYLLCFAWWGYEFVFSENGKYIRDVIAGKKDYPCPVPIKWLEKEQMQPTGVSLLQDHDERLGFVINIYLKGIKVDTTAVILIPGPTNNGWENLTLINEINNGKQIKEYQCLPMPRIVHRIGYTMSWNIALDT